MDRTFRGLCRRAGEFVDKILRGVKPAEILIEKQTKFELVLSLRTAKALRLKIPDRYCYAPTK